VMVQAKQCFSVKGWKHALKVQVPLLPHGLSLIILGASNKILISRFAGIAQVGIYSVAYSAGYIVNVLKTSIFEALKPWIYQRMKEKNYASIRKNVNLVTILVAIVSVTFTVFGPEIIRLMAPIEYHEAIYVIPPIAASSYLAFLYNVFSIVGLYYEKTTKIMWASIIAAILNIILGIICIPIWGYIVAAYATMFCYAFLAFAHFLIMQSISKVELDNEVLYDNKFIFLISIIVVISVIIFTLIYDILVIRYGIIIVMGIVLFIKRERFLSLVKELKNSKAKK
jgi:Membrane protein involved in the export of O-antigen and teichoic acid